MYAWLSSLLSRQLIDRKNGHRRAVIARYGELLRVSRMPDQEIRAYQDQRLADLLNHAAQQVPFWREHLRTAITPANARLLLSGLPVMDRALIQADGPAFVAAQSTGAVDDATGGSTGTPMKFRVDARAQIAREASLYWANHLAGWRYGDRVAMLWGSDRDVGKAKKDRRLELRWHIDNMRWYNAFDMGEPRMAEFHADMQKFRPHIVVAYSGSLDLYARYLAQALKLPRRAAPSATRDLAYPLTSLVSSAEVLLPEMRSHIESVFSRPVFNRYGNRECGAIAAEDQHGGLLVNEGDMIVEINSPDPVREPGPIWITHLSNYAMPFIRYNTGDLGVWQVGSDGQPDYRRIARIQGRQGDTIRTRSGNLIHGEYFTHLMYGARGIKEFQFVQESLERYRLLVVGETLDDQLLASWRHKLAEVLGSDAVVEINQVESIPTLPSGKRKFTISKIKV